MSTRPATLYLALLGEVVLLHPYRDDLSTALFYGPIGAAVAVLGLAGCITYLGLRRWGPRLAALGFASQALWFTGWLGTPGVVIGSALVVVGLARTITPLTVVQLVISGTTVVGSLFDPTLTAMLFILGLPTRCVHLHAATHDSIPVLPNLPHTIAAAARALWMRVAAGVAFGVMLAGGVTQAVPENVVMGAAVALYLASTLAVATLALRALQLGPLRPTGLAIGAASLVWGAVVLAYHSYAAYKSLYGHGYYWDGENMFLAAQLAVAAGTTIVTVALSNGLAARELITGEDAHAFMMRAIATGAVSLTAIILERVVMASGGDTSALIFLLLAASLHLLASGILADATSTVARRLGPDLLPTARAAA